MLNPSPIGGLSFRIAAILICTTCIFYTAVMRSFNRKKIRGRLFLVLLVLTVIDCITGVVSTVISNSAASEQAKDLVTYICKMVYYATHMAFTPVLSIYVMVVSEVFHRLNKVTLTLFVTPFILLELAVLTNPITNIIFIQEGHQFYSRGVGVYIAYGISALYVLYCFFLLGRYWSTMNKLQKVAMFYFMALAAIGTIIQMLIPIIVCELMGEALGLMGIMIMIERDDYRLDYKTHAYNRAALMHDLNNMVSLKRHFYTICVRIENAETFRRLIGNDGYDFIIAKGADFLRELNPRFETYRTTAGNFFILCPEAAQKDVDYVIQQIEDRFKDGFMIKSGRANVRTRILCAKCPEELEDVEDILLLSDTDIEDTDKIVFRGDDLEFLLRKIEIEKAIVRGLNGDGFRVMYQPVYEKETRRVFSAEALLTLDDPILGTVDFRDFMSVSNETGFVEELEYRMIESAVRFVKNGILRGNAGLNLIVIHIMSVHVVKPELVEKVRQFVQENEVNPNYFAFSVSDNIAIQTQEILTSIIDEFDKLGVRFVLANSDAGLLGLNPQIVSKFSGVAIDVRRQYETSDISQAGIIMQNRIAMVKQLGKIAIIRGVDNKQYYDVIKDLPVDYLAGDYLSEMVNKNELQVMFWHKDVFWD